MKYINYINMKSWIAALVLSAGLFAACSDDVLVGQVDESKYTTGDGSVMGYVSDSYGKRMFSNVEFRSSGSVSLHFKTTAKLTMEAAVTVTYDETVLTEYNNKYGTSYEVFPKNEITFENGGVIKLNAGDVQSSEMKVSYVSDFLLRISTMS